MTAASDPPGIAIIGIGCRFPGAVDHRAFWRNLCGGVEAITPLADEALTAAGVAPDLLRNPDYVKAAALLPEADCFDAAFFEYSPQEARLMDPQQRLLLEVAWEAFEDAGIRPGASPAPVGVFVGSGGVVTSYLVDRLGTTDDLPGPTGGVAHLGNDKDFPSTRISYKLNLTGPSINVQTACSTSLVAVHLACQSILSGECDMALAGAATVRVPQRAGYLSVKGGILSPDGHCRAFDADAQGTVFGSGVGVVLLKELAAAIADRDPIYAVIRGSAINNDGGDKVSYTASSVAGQSRAMVEAMAVAEVTPDEIGYVECHGTGTIVGDPLEIDALTRAFRTGTERRGFCAIGSVKTNLGHLEQTAGIASLIKAALALRHGKIPPSLNFNSPNPKIDFAASPFFVATECQDWTPASGPRRAAVNSLGLGGTNAFVVLEQAPPGAASADERPPLHLLTLSARTEAGLRQSITRHRAWLGETEESVADICFTAACGRTHFAKRYVAIADSKDRLRELLADDHAVNGDAGAAGRIGFLFSGQASQYAGMGAELYRHQPVFRDVIDRCAEVLRDRLQLPLTDVLFQANETILDDTGYTQPALFAVQAALVALWRSWGIVPDAVLGHSVGEFAAAHCAGVYSLDEGLRLIADRAGMMASLPRTGTMAAVFADEPTVAAALQSADPESIAIAAVNGPNSTVISGERDAVKAMTGHFASAGTTCQMLAVSHAFHSPLMRPAMDALGQAAAAVAAREPQLAWISTVSAEPMTTAPDAQYWCEHALAPVRFADAMLRLGNSGITTLIEIGPGNTLLGLGRQCVNGVDRAWLGSLSRRGEWREILSSVGELHRGGHAVDWDNLYGTSGRRISLPTYPFDRTRFWIDGDASASRPGARAPRSAPGVGSLAGTHLRSPLAEVQFESTYSLQGLPYLDDHRIYGMAVLPTTVGLCALHEAARRHFGTEAVEVANLQYREAMVLADTGARTVQSILTQVDATTAEFRFVSTDGAAAGAWRNHMVGLVRTAPTEAQEARLSVEQVQQRCCETIAVDRYYAALHRLGLQYGPSFRGIDMLRRGAGEVLARIRLPAHLSAAEGPHPALLDACLHIYPALIDHYRDLENLPAVAAVHLPIGVERFRASIADMRDVWVYAIRRHVRDDVVTIDIAIHRDDGSFAGAIEGLALKPLAPDALTPVAAGRPDWLYEMRWDERPPLAELTASTEPGAWLILSDRTGVGAALAALIESRGDQCRVLRGDDFDPTKDSAKRLRAALTGKSSRTRRKLRGIVNLLPLDHTADNAKQIERAQKILFETISSVVRITAERRGDAGAARIWMVTRNAIPARPDDPPTEVATATMWGLGRSAALEHPQIWGGLLDLGIAAPVQSDAEAILRELLADDGEDQIALRSGQRYCPRFVRASMPTARSRLDAAGSYLITGGLGALAVETAKELIERHGVRHLVLMSRRGPDDPKAALVCEALAALGADVRVVKGDVTRERDLRRVLARIGKAGPPLKGVFHCAGLLDDGILARMDWNKFQRVLAPKVTGAWLLHELTRELGIEHFVLFSSILSLIGSPGQANYAAANAFIDALVARRQREGLPALAINFGPWEESGLATESGDKGRAIWRARGTDYIGAETGRQALSALLGSDRTHAAITITRWPVFLEQFSPAPRLYEELEKEAGAAKRTTDDGPTLRSRLSQSSGAERRGLLAAFIQQQVMKTLGITTPFDIAQPLNELGLDSLMSVTLVNRIEATLGVRISAVQLIQGPSVAQLVEYIASELPDQPEPSTDTAEPAGPTNGASVGGSGSWLVVVGPRAAPRMRLFCFPFAGGGSAVYRGWAQDLDPGIEVIAVEPPGRLARIQEKPIAAMSEFVDQLTAEMHGLLDRPFAFFGHCLGGLTMYETARRLIHTTGMQPSHLFASGARPPDRIVDLGPFEERLMQDLLNLATFRVQLPAYAQADDVFSQLIRHFRITATEQLLENRELRDLMFPVVRAEFQMASDYIFKSEPPWDIPITCFVAREDPYVSRRHAFGWGRFTNTRFQVFMREGAHFAVVDDREFIQSVINRELKAHAFAPPNEQFVHRE